MTEYDITEAFRAVEKELIESMIRNMDRHRAEETEEGIEWSMWQAEQLKALEKYKKENQKKYEKQFRKINGEIEVLLKEARDRGNMEQEIQILEAIKKGFKGRKKIGKGATAEFFRLNERKLEALIEATVQDMEKAETAILRKAEDDYRKAIFNAQVYVNTGSGTYEKAVDMATKDMLSRGLNCIVYANGACHTLADYADMALRTAGKRAYLQGEGEKRQEWGIATVIVNKRGNPCPKCLPFCGKVLIDDVWSGGSKDGVDPETGKRYPLMSTAIEYGLYHPRCRDSHTTYFPGISTADDTWTKKELEAIEAEYQADQKKKYAKRQAEKYGRLAEYSLDGGNKTQYEIKADEWKSVEKSIANDMINALDTKEVVEVHSAGRINKEIYKCITEEIVTDEVIITDERIAHIKERHPNDYERFCSYIPEIILHPDYIIEANKPNTGVILKEIEEHGEKFKLVLRIKVQGDPKEYKNSIMTFWHIGETTWKKSLKNKKILYKRE